MFSRFRSPRVLWFVWGGLLLASVFLLTHPSSIVFWGIVAVAAVTLVAQMVNSYKRAEWEQQTVSGIETQLGELGAVIDLKGDEGALELLDVQQWEDVFQALEAMPKGPRSLREAILKTHPYAIRGSA